MIVFVFTLAYSEIAKINVNNNDYVLLEIKSMHMLII